MPSRTELIVAPCPPVSLGHLCRFQTSAGLRLEKFRRRAYPPSIRRSIDSLPLPANLGIVRAWTLVRCEATVTRPANADPPYIELALPSVPQPAASGMTPDFLAIPPFPNQLIERPGRHGEVIRCAFCPVSCSIAKSGPREGCCMSVRCLLLAARCSSSFPVGLAPRGPASFWRDEERVAALKIARF